MKQEYNGFYRTKLDSANKKKFKDKALKFGSVTDVHDALMNLFIETDGEILRGRYGAKTK